MSDELLGAIASVGSRIQSLTRDASRRLFRRTPPPKLKQTWSIGIYAGRSPLELREPAGIRNPVLTRDDISDVPAEFVADPFMVRVGGVWHMLFEVKNARSRKGEIALATSPDARRWSYEGIVLAEPFHLSYPYTFEWNGEVYMVPETGRAGAVRLYRADRGLRSWTLAGTLLHGSDLVDASLFQALGGWWMFVQSSPMPRHDTLRLYAAPDLMGPWREHPASPVVDGDPSTARPAGRVLTHGGRIVRFAQDCGAYYGTAVRAFEIVTLTPEAYEERPVNPAPLLSGSGRGWNAGGMHHVDAHLTEGGQWLACVDGWIKLPVAPAS